MSDDEIGVGVVVGWRASINKLVLLSIYEERLSLRIELARSDENSSGVSLLLLVLLGMHLKKQEKKFMPESGLNK